MMGSAKGSGSKKLLEIAQVQETLGRRRREGLSLTWGTRIKAWLTARPGREVRGLTGERTVYTFPYVTKTSDLWPLNFNEWLRGARPLQNKGFALEPHVITARTLSQGSPTGAFCVEPDAAKVRREIAVHRLVDLRAKIRLRRMKVA